MVPIAWVLGEADLQSANNLEADYLIIGAGATAMAFADTLLAESDSTAIIVDRRHKPGGHWNDAYPFVRLHGPSANYGVNSSPLGSNRIDLTGLNEGLFELATGSEICTYFDEVMRYKLLPTGRVRYFPMHDYNWSGEAISLLSGKRLQLTATKKIVDATIADTKIPSCTPPAFKVDSLVSFIPPNDLTKLAAAPGRVVIVGGGKTAIDAVTWLLTNGAHADQITWIRPRDAWLLNRATVQPDHAFFEQTFGALAAGFEAAARAQSADDIFLHLESLNYMRRIDPSVTPSMYRCAIVSDKELELIRQVKDVVRLGRIESIEPGKIILEQGEVSIEPRTVFVNCTADGIPRKAPEPIFQARRIVPQYVRQCQPTFSGALVAKVEISLQSDDEKNALCAPVPIPDKPCDWPGMVLAQTMNSAAWRKQDWLMSWLVEARLDQFTKMALQAQSEAESVEFQTAERYRAAVKSGVEKVAQLAAAAS